MMPFPKEEHPEMDSLTKNKFNVMLEQCDTSELIRTRDKLMLMILYNSGVRVSGNACTQVFGYKQS